MIDYTQHSTNIPFDIECLTYRVLKVNELELYSPNDLDAKGDRKLANTLVHTATLCVSKRNEHAQKKKGYTCFVLKSLRTFARKTSTIQIFFILWLQSDNELPMSEMEKNWGVTDFVFEIKRVKNYPNFDKSALVTRHGLSDC